MNVLKKIGLTITIICATLMLWGQNVQPKQSEPSQITDKQISLFVNALVAVMPIQQQAENDKIKAVESNGLTIDEFNRLSQKFRAKGKEGSIDENTLKTFERIAKEIQIIKQTAQIETTRAITKAGLTPEEYLELITAYNTDTEAKAKVDKLLKERN
ncbi:MAG TPA: DUF4168 domain-containing protein [Bacteroidetes bacterium]|nr:DUF4168 domain-containing protein [Bacteroidota bacterium]